MKANKIAGTTIIILFILFFALFISQSTGYYDYEAYKKTALTKEQIKKFEEDVKNGKNVSVKDYLSDTIKDYGNNVSDVGLSVSKNIEKYSKKTIEAIFGALSNLITNWRKTLINIIHNNWNITIFIV